MKHKQADNEPARASALEQRLIEMLVDAAIDGQSVTGRGALCVTSDTGGVSWTYKSVEQCGDMVGEWPDLEQLLTSYDARSEVVVVLNETGDFFRLPTDPDSPRRRGK